MAGALLERGRVEDAAVAYRKAALDPGNPDPGKALVNLGLCFMALDRPADAVEAYQAALGFDTYEGRAKRSRTSVWPTARSAATTTPSGRSRRRWAARAPALSRSGRGLRDRSRERGPERDVEFVGCGVRPSSRGRRARAGGRLADRRDPAGRPSSRAAHRRMGPAWPRPLQSPQWSRRPTTRSPRPCRPRSRRHRRPRRRPRTWRRSETKPPSRTSSA